MGKWYKTGFEEGLAGLWDPPSYPGKRDYESYKEGYRDGVNQAERDAEHDFSDRVRDFKERNSDGHY